MSDDEGKGRSAQGSIEIDASPDQVWRALTDPRELERWFPLDASVEPGEGGYIRMSWRNEFDAKAEILVWDPPRHLRTGWEWGGQVTDYYIEARKGGGTVLRAVTSGFPDDPTWDAWVEGTRRGWAFELRSLRHYLERHEGEDREVLYLRRRIDDGAPEEIWERLERMLPERWTGGRVVDDSAPVQRAYALEEPDGLLRISVEPSVPDDPRVRDVTLFLSAWGSDRKALAEPGGSWPSLLERTFPEGRAP